MKKTVLFLAMCVSTMAFAANPNPCGNHGNNCGQTPGAGGNASSAATQSLNATLNSKNTAKSTAVSTSVSVSEGGDASAIQFQGQGQKQSQSQTAKGGSADNQLANSWAYSDNEAKNAASGAAALVVQVASACGGSAGATGQGFGGGGGLGFAFEFMDCKILREAAFLIALGKMEAGLQHAARNIDRIGETLELTDPAFQIKRSKVKQNWTTAGRK